MIRRVDSTRAATRRRLRGGLVTAIALLLAGAAPEPAHAEVIERVAAVVNDHAILLSDLRRKAAPFLEQALSDAKSASERQSRLETIYQRLLDQLVDEELVEQAARKMHVTVNESEVDQAIDNVRRQNNLDEQAFWRRCARRATASASTASTCANSCCG